MIMIKVYLETTIFNRFLEDNREYNIETKSLFEKIVKNEIKAYSSTYVIEELDKASEPKRTEIVHRMKGFGNPVICTPMEVL